MATRTTTACWKTTVRAVRRQLRVMLTCSAAFPSRLGGCGTVFVMCRYVCVAAYGRCTDGTTTVQTIDGTGNNPNVRLRPGRGMRMCALLPSHFQVTLASSPFVSYLSDLTYAMCAHTFEALLSVSCTVCPARGQVVLFFRTSRSPWLPASR